MNISIQDWLSIIYIALGIVVTALSCLIPLIKSEKAKKAAQRALAIATAVQPYIVEAEKFINYTGEEKLAYVQTKANQYAISNNIKFDAVAVTEQIESLVALTKKVNQRDKDKVVETEKVETINNTPTETEITETCNAVVENDIEEPKIVVSPSDIIIEGSTNDVDMETETITTNESVTQ